MKILVTGSAGFIGFHLARVLLEEGHEVVGLDNLNDYYSVQLKLDRLKQTGITMPDPQAEPVNAGEKAAGASSSASTGSPIENGNDSSQAPEPVQSDIWPRYRFYHIDLTDRGAMDELFAREAFDAVVHLAAQPGVRYSLENPHAYTESNITGFLNILEGCRHHPVKHLVFASSSSVYGANTRMPFSVKDNVDHPVSLYAASKKANELMAHTYAHLYGIPATGLRFFTVYGPWGRPDMAPMLFTDAMLHGRPIKVFNHGNMERDFTYIGDIVESIRRLVPLAPEPDPSWSGDRPDPATSHAPYRVFNIGNNSPVKLMDFIGEIEKQLGVTADKQMMDMQPGDVPKTWADVTDLIEVTGYRPQVSVAEGVERFVKWYRKYFGVAL